MNNEKRIEDKIGNLLKRTENAGFTKPPVDYFEHFTDRLPLDKSRGAKIITFSRIRSRLMQAGSLAVAALLLLSLWIFVFDAGIKKDLDVIFTAEELMTLNDFQNYNEDLIYSELSLVSDNDQLANDAEVDALLNVVPVSADEIIELYSNSDIK